MKTLRTTLLGLLAIAGCTVEGSVRFEPIGGDVDVEASWTINGETPTVATCDAIGASTVELQVWDASRDNFYTEAAWEVDCASGGFTTARVLLADTYELRFVALNNVGGVVAETPYIRVTALAGDTIVASADFVSDVVPTQATVTGTWTVGGAEANATTCDIGAVATVRLDIATDAAGSDIAATLDSACTDGGIPSSILVDTGETYYYRWTALDATGGVLSESDWLVLTVGVDDATAPLGAPDFPATGAIINIFWEEGLDVGTFGTCETAAVSTMGYDVYDSADNMVVSDFTIPCDEQLIFSEITPDTYSIDFTGDATDGTKWGTTCSGVAITDGQIGIYDCEVEVSGT